MPSAAPAQTEQTNLDLRIQASSSLNLDPQGRAAPILVRIYELRGHQSFQDADFFSLYNADRSTLGNDVLAVDQFIMRPDQTHTIQRKSHPEVRAIGVLAGYRDLPNATWRAIQPIPTAPEATWYRSWLPNRSLQLHIDLLPTAVRITDLRQGNSPRPPNDPRAGTEMPANTVPLQIPPPDLSPALPTAPLTGDVPISTSTPPVPAKPANLSLEPRSPESP